VIINYIKSMLCGVAVFVYYVNAQHIMW